MMGRMVLFGASGDLASRLLMPAVGHSNPMLFIHGDEAEEAWRIIDPMMKTWTAGDVPMQEYPAGQTPPGPSS
jgi:glucose-6-phosphate 1-dehydrogenase